MQTEELEREQPEPEPEYYDDVEVDDGYFPVESGDREQGDVEGDGEEAGLEPVDLSLGDEGDVDVGEAGERELDRDVGIGIEAPLEPEPEGEPAYDGQEGELVEGGEMQ